MNLFKWTAWRASLHICPARRPMLYKRLMHASQSWHSSKLVHVDVLLLTDSLHLRLPFPVFPLCFIHRHSYSSSVFFSMCVIHLIHSSLIFAGDHFPYSTPHWVPNGRTHNISATRDPSRWHVAVDSEAPVVSRKEQKCVFYMKKCSTKYFTRYSLD